MRRTLIIGIVLVALGILGLIFPRITYRKDTTALALGPLQIQTVENKSIPVPQVAAGAALAAGIVLVVVGAGRRS